MDATSGAVEGHGAGRRIRDPGRVPVTGIVGQAGAWTGLDAAVQRWVVGHRTAALVDAARAVTWAGDSVVVGLVAIAGTTVLWRRRSVGRVASRSVGRVASRSVARAASRSVSRAAVTAAPVLAWLAVEIAARLLKVVVRRPRPPLTAAVVRLSGWSLPAAHVGRALVALGVIGAVTGLPRVGHRGLSGWTGAAAAVAVVTVAVGGARVVLGSAWATDTLPAALLGIAAAVVVVRAARSAQAAGSPVTSVSATNADGTGNSIGRRPPSAS